MGDFDQLKEDLLWEGSEVAALSRDENKYLAAMQAYMEGSPILSDTEFDELKQKLKADSSPIAVSKEPKCFVDTGICTVSVVVTLLWVVIAYELTPLKFVDPI